MSHLTIGIRQKPTAGKWMILSFQHVFAMFGSTVLVPILTGLPISTALLTSGIGTIIYILLTKARCPMYLGSSFAFITPICTALAANTVEGLPNYAAVCTGIMGAGLIYCLMALIIRFVGTGWLNKLLPPVVVGPMIIVIGLSLAGVACSNAGFVPGEDGLDYQVIGVALISVLTTALVAVYAKGFFKIVPIMSGIAVGYLAAIAMDLIFNRGDASAQMVLPALRQVGQDFTSIKTIFSMPRILLPFGNGFSIGEAVQGYQLDFSAFLVIVPVALVTAAEHIGDHKVLGQICGKDFIKDPGLDRTLAGDGIATFFAGLIGGPANTSYGENTGVVGMTKVGSVYVTGGAAVIAIALSFIQPVRDFIASIPGAVMGGICIILFGLIASNGLRVMQEAKIDFNNTRNVIIASVMLVIGLGGAVLSLKGVEISGMALSAVTGIILNLILPERKGAKIEMADEAETE